MELVVHGKILEAAMTLGSHVSRHKSQSNKGTKVKRDGVCVFEEVWKDWILAYFCSFQEVARMSDSARKLLRVSSCYWLGSLKFAGV